MVKLDKDSFRTLYVREQLIKTGFMYYALRGYPRHSMRNVVRAMNSLKRVTELWMTTAAAHVHHGRGKKGALRAAAVVSGWYSHIIYARPDLRYVSPLNVTLLRGLNDDELYTPSWACWQGGFLCRNHRISTSDGVAVRLTGFEHRRVQRQVRRGPARRRRGVRDEIGPRTARRPAAEVAPLAMGY